ncbi:DNA internalization-related competence protein ComEC/Rec2 [Streptococcus oricebi]|uniref:DNA internalization-related competence protein ComEC/Rec2 n=1 Tax=Streptococcus oricebi TaxID=1547447 RepID=A0ABS5B1H1_9STRE|nr:DNA internalization-related competence protein ComEC/Rec2 [Streptococcus oricebi]MBP2622663.1 DNA internalization-related competence protein ComEC/Rec2 [Streptococcus oricebi]
MSQWIKKLPLPPIYLAFLLLLAYFAIYVSNLLSLAVLCFGLYRLFFFYPLKTGLLSLCLLAPFFLFFAWQRFSRDQEFLTAPKSLSQLVLLPDTIQVNGSSLSFRARQEGRTYQVYYQLKSATEQEFFQHLSDLTLLEVRGDLSLAEEERNFSGFNYRAYLKSQGIDRIFKIRELRSQKPLSAQSPFDFLSVWRRRALVYIKEKFPGPMSHYMTGLLFGDLDQDFQEMTQLYSSLGILHLFALSGMQVGFFVTGFRKCLLRLGLRREIVDILQLLFSFIYAGLTGFSVSVLRSLVQKFLAQKGLASLDGFALTLMILSLISPSFLLTVGGLLSCAYAFIIAMLGLEDLPSSSRIFRESLVLSLGILPLLIFFFSEFQVWSVLLTLLFSLVFDWALLPLLSLAFLLSPLFIWKDLNYLFVGLEKLVQWFAQAFPRPLILGKPPLWLLLLLLLTLALLYDFRRHKTSRLLLGPAVLLLFMGSKFPLENEITLVDIGQGDSIFLRDWRGQTILIDVGGRLDFNGQKAWQKRKTSSNASKTLLPYLKSRGVDHLDQLFLTHADQDHVGDLLEVARELPIRDVYITEGSLQRQDFLKDLAQLKSSIHLVAVGDRFPIFDQHLEVLYPSGSGDGGNNDSIVLYGEFYGTSFLFTGDLEREGEQNLLKSFPQLQADVLKLGHHGSKGSSSPEFLAQIAPKISLISAGKNNRYHHPHQETLERLNKIGSIIHRTDQEGAIRFRGWQSWQLETVR